VTTISNGIDEVYKYNESYSFKEATSSNIEAICLYSSNNNRKSDGFSDSKEALA